MVNPHPYKNLDEKFFWATAVAKRNMFDISQLWEPKFRIDNKSRICTFGSCFAQHIGRALESRGFNWQITEKAPSRLSSENAIKFNYGAFTARTGNIYTVSLLKQWVDWAVNDTPIPSEVWENKCRYIDPFRPKIEPNGFHSVDELLHLRRVTVQAFREAITTSNVFVFTLGLTESWFNKREGYEYPLCPGTVGGIYDPDIHRFLNQDYSFIQETLTDTIVRIREMNPGIKLLLTVSPVPLTATMSGNHVLTATVESKSILRAVAGYMRRKYPFVDYYPAYEIINSPPYRGTFFESNQRNVNHAGVTHVMNIFFECLNAKYPVSKNEQNQSNIQGEIPAFNKHERGDAQEGSGMLMSVEDAICEEELLDAFKPTL